jgi:hypothetical protein
MPLLQHAHVQLAQAGVKGDIAAACVGDNFRRAPGAPQIAADNVGNAQSSDARPHQHRLTFAGGGQRAVGLTLNAPLGVPLRFTVANKVYL